MTIDITKISSTPIQGGGQPQNNQAGKATLGEESTKAVSDADTVELTEEMKKLQNLQDKIADLPDVDADKVEALKQAIAEGSYKIDAQNIADKIVDLESA